MIPTVLDQFPTPPCARLLALDVLAEDKAARTVRLSFQASPTFCNASGNIQGGLLAAMLDDSMGPAVLIATDAKLYPVTVSMTVTYLSAAKAGPLFGEALVRQLGKTIGCVEAALKTVEGVEVARAVSSVRLMSMPAP